MLSLTFKKNTALSFYYSQLITAAETRLIGQMFVSQ